LQTIALKESTLKTFLRICSLPGFQSSAPCANWGCSDGIW